jgi:hypothetical protein
MNIMKNKQSYACYLLHRYALKFESPDLDKQIKGYLSRHFIRTYYHVNHNGNEIKRYTLAKGYGSKETDQKTLGGLIRMLEKAIDAGEALL